ncbi:tryptophan--tRNA ligase [Candidatus Micrarchaeota archaeon]|nr:tryptophan--tRNA ligase [Candidatus Micrarchaeota archaeon]MBU2477405.1 tryptophan--tRNA ligase [Candidatus Micrarchaeota archaeon]
MNKIDPWGTELIEDYARLIKDFGLEPMEDFLSDFPKPNYLMRRGIVFAGQDLKQIADAIKEKKPFYCLTGMMPSSERIHFGTKTVIEMVKYFQEQKAKTFVLIADLESAATRGISLKEARERALNFYIPAYIALGLDPKKTIFYFQSENDQVKNLAYLFSQKITMNEFKAIYGEIHPSRILSALAQAGDILFPQLEEKMPGVIPVGIDQSPHIRLTRDIVRRTKSEFNFFLPSATYHKFVPALDGSNKMSKSNPNSFISIPENPIDSGKKMSKALTGGRNTIEEQKKLGGIPEKCMVFEMYKQHLIEDDKKLQKIFDDCKKGKLLCKEDKENAVNLMILFQQDFQKKLDKAKKTRKQWKFFK